MTSEREIEALASSIEQIRAARYTLRDEHLPEDVLHILAMIARRLASAPQPTQRGGEGTW